MCNFQKKLISAVGKVTKVDEEQQKVEVNFGTQSTVTLHPSNFVKVNAVACLITFNIMYIV